MAEQTREYLKSRFEDGDVPNGADFADLIDSFMNKEDIRPFCCDVAGHMVVGGVMILGHFANLSAALSEASRSEVSGARGVAVIRFTYSGAAGSVASFILQTIKGDDVCIQYIFDRGSVSVRSITGATGSSNGNPSVVRVEDTWMHRLRWNGNNIEAIGYQPYGGTEPVLATVAGVAKTSQLPTAASASRAGLMSATHYSKLTALPDNATLEQRLKAQEARIAQLEERLAAGVVLLERQAASDETEE